MNEIDLIPILEDNYCYVFESGDALAVVDPGEAAPVIKYLEQRGQNPTHILITHHHWDHVNGVAELVQKYGCAVYGPKAEASKIPNISKSFKGGDVFKLGSEEIHVIDTPGHTLGHIVFYLPKREAVFAGDTLFSMGCGRVFEGTMEQMFSSMDAMNALPDETMLYCGHEYTLSNAKFCLSIEPDNKILQSRADEVKTLHAADKPTLPVSLAIEKQTNVFLRAGSAERFAELRRMKDNF